jgi:protein-L-isoaspartate(D-aspartate) O-methyltransferase
MVIPLGDRFTQSVHLVIKRDGKLIDKELKPTLFVPMTGKALNEGPEPKAKATPDVPSKDQPKAARGRGRSTKSQSKASAKEPS